MPNSLQSVCSPWRSTVHYWESCCMPSLHTMSSSLERFSCWLCGVHSSNQDEGYWLQRCKPISCSPGQFLCCCPCGLKTDHTLLSERIYMGLPEHIDTILNWTKQNWTAESSSSWTWIVLEEEDCWVKIETPPTISNSDSCHLEGHTGQNFAVSSPPHSQV